MSVPGIPEVDVHELARRLKSSEPFVLLDVRNPDEWEARRIETPQAKLLPLPELREKLSELPEKKEIVTFCRTSVRAYQAQRILDGAGFKDVRFMDGSITAWPYDTAGTKKDDTQKES